MAAGARSFLRGGGIVGRLRVPRSRSQVHGGRKFGGSGGVRKVGGADSRELGAHGGRIEQGKSWILVRGCRIGRAGLRFNNEGEVYVPDSEDEEADMETGYVVAKGAAAMKVATARSPAAAVATDVGPTVVVAAHGAPAMDVSVDNDSGMVLAPEVQVRLKAVLAGKDPRHHDFFISLYKVMVPALFKSD
ncbi:unnamed protein product [Urochloa humidicola]